MFCGQGKKPLGVFASGFVQHLHVMLVVQKRNIT